ncbi:TonB-dependent receptor [Flavitalea sp. BT771]|uniref:TonB-dependent receptor n=1 Tax=Flavitalea sp. BT771 TaxID=3063329 RepID=UPI0026E3DFBC|nr:TonB-dependent receptor [Flavitalea sp. BT771]MDO6430046.1 TonB-dependent receptor [Flavitalea sp. BT771]MDV6219815.1 TonB-dependent receptor [Flavitalea sp. BT771]
MKFAAIFLISASMAASANGFSQQITLAGKNVPLTRVFKEIQKQSGFDLIYTYELVEPLGNISVHLRHASLKEALDECLKDKPLTYRIEDKTVIIQRKAQATTLLKEEAPSPVELKGKVTDEQGRPVPGASVKLKASNLGTATNTDGEFTLSVPDEPGILIFSSIGYKTKEVGIGSNRFINVSLAAEPGGLNEVVVVGYGTQKKATLTGSVAEVKGDEIVKSQAINVAGSLAGQLPGVIINSPSGEPGRNDPSIYIRGMSTTGNNSVLVVIDGVERGGLGQLNPNDIESISVLKDASAAIYGAQAANGVILVTTKKGSLGSAPKVDFSYNEGLSQPTRNPVMANSYTFAQVSNEINAQQGLAPAYSATDLEKYKAGNDPDHPNTDWYKFIVKNWTPQHRANLSVSGGNNGTTYFLSFGQVYQAGQYKSGTENIKQYNLRANIGVQVSKYLKVGVNLAGRVDNNHFPYNSANQLNSHIFLYQPNWQPYWPGTKNPQPLRGSENIVNWVSDNAGYRTQKVNTFQSTGYINWQLPWVKGLSVEGSGSYDPNSTYVKTFREPDFVYYKDPGTGVLTRGRSGMGTDQATLNDNISLGSLLYLTAKMHYERKFGLHYIKALLGYEQTSTYSNFDEAYRSNFPSTVLPQIFAGSSDPNQQSNNGSASQTARQNEFGRVNYDYAGKYLAEFTMRRDGSPNFPANKRWGYFPSASAGWRLSQERFMKKYTFINELKIRASYGVMGNDLVAPFQYLTNYGYGNNYVIGGSNVIGLVQTGVPNPNITWETAKTGNVGLDATLWNGLLGITFDYFQTRRSDILTTAASVVPGYTGLTLPDENIGIVDNKGFELVLSHTNNRHKFQYSISGNLAFARNRVIYGNAQPGLEPYQLAKGHPIGAGLYYEAMGIFKDQADIDSYAHMPGTVPGDIKYRDINHDASIDSRDQILKDQTNIPQMTFGLNSNFRYKGFELSILLQGQANVKQYFGGYFPVMSYSLGNFLNWRADNRWSPANTNATMPRASYENFNNNTNNSTQWLIDAGFLRVKNVSFSYNLPQNIANHAGMKNLRFSVNANNLFLIYDHMKALGFDPETTDYWYYPPQRVISFGINATF